MARIKNHGTYTANVEKTMQLIAGLNYDEMVALNWQLVDRIKAEQQARSQKAMSAVRVNELYTFNGGRRRGTIMIKVTGMSRQRVLGLQTDLKGNPLVPHLRWRVSPQLLQPYKKLRVVK